MTDLINKKCLACEGYGAALLAESAEKLLQQVPNWQISSNGKEIFREFTFKNFYQTMAFVNAVAWIANTQNHHPDMEIGYQRCKISYTTHALGGLTENDFICAAKINLL